ncbi:hypothetical protein ACUY3K_00710 [Corynebacterium uberis]|uniref:hypothetical protein n=1 Tax=Corynebacterium TaxID=1716 RepID=UPI001D0B91C6|nr:hypothetical protein [Corynebacterium uberis]MCZ9309048.1 hypothetical protein [Corynebacterium sp. c6VSa_13]UDL74487.1 hypothetical protein LH391_04655 [Corynebacterium uberis]UDL76678.1 hypothetical protein LH393_04740 [Corynebacterium uberis]UDL78891.1 hypothetical protein LH394_04730 [Corynebacterium uberis]UDL81169.1 hypothetical protein LH392_05150 [Corynebacterium uberis]
MTETNHGFLGGAPRPLRVALRWGAVALIALTVVMAAVWTAVAGLPGLWGALVGAAVAGAFMLLTVLSVAATSRSSIGVLGAVVLGGWLLKMVVAMGVMWYLSQLSFYHRPALVVTVLAALVVVLTSETLGVVRTREPYVDPDREAKN